MTRTLVFGALAGALSLLGASTSRAQTRTASASPASPVSRELSEPGAHAPSRDRSAEEVSDRATPDAVPIEPAAEPERATAEPAVTETEAPPEPESATGRAPGVGRALAPAEEEEEDVDTLFEGEVRVSFRSAAGRWATLYTVDEPERWLALGGIPFHAYEPVCNAPCRPILPRGRQILALGHQGAAPRTFAWVDVEEGSELVARYSDHSVLRMIGCILLIVGSAASIGLAVGAGFIQDRDLAIAMGVASGVVALDSLGLGLAFAALEDGSRLRVE
ncbi:MAG: hypothetical protein AB7S26_12555 [Sandaracinaceae bacterium]